jgi:hypothetical protein
LGGFFHAQVASRTVKQPILRLTKAAGSGGGEAVGPDHNEAKAIGRFYGTRQREVHCDVRFTPDSGH